MRGPRVHGGNKWCNAGPACTLLACHQPGTVLAVVRVECEGSSSRALLLKTASPVSSLAAQCSKGGASALWKLPRALLHLENHSHRRPPGRTTPRWHPRWAEEVGPEADTACAAEPNVVFCSMCPWLCWHSACNTQWMRHLHERLVQGNGINHKVCTFLSSATWRSSLSSVRSSWAIRCRASFTGVSCRVTGFAVVDLGSPERAGVREVAEFIAMMLLTMYPEPPMRDHLMPLRDNSVLWASRGGQPGSPRAPWQGSAC